MHESELRKRLSAFEFVDLAGPVPDSSIETAERELGVAFPPQYRDFVSKFGCGGIGPEEIIGLGGPDYLNIVSLARQLRERTNPLPEPLLPLRADGFGNYDCLDTSAPTDDGEYQVVEWNHEGRGAKAKRPIADRFDDWLSSLLSMAEGNA